MKYTVVMSYNFNVPVEFVIESKKNLTEEQLLDIIRKSPHKTEASFDTSLIEVEESNFYEAMESKQDWKTIVEENLSLDDVICDA